MKNSLLPLFLVLMLLLIPLSLADTRTAANNTTLLNGTTGQAVQSNAEAELLMDTTFSAREFALESGRDRAISEFSNLNGSFSKNGVYVFAVNNTGVILANPLSPGSVKKQGIVNDHDAGIIRQMRDVAVSGGGLYQNETSGAAWFVLDIDGSWWIAAGKTSL